MNIRTKDGKIDFKKLFIQSGLYLVLFLMLVLIIAKEPSFLSIRNFKNILTQSSVRAIIALGVAGLIVTQGTDLSVGRQVGFSAVISATLLQATTNVNKVFPNLAEFPVIGAIIIVMIVGMIIGSINGLIVAKLNVHPFIATLGMMTIVYGVNSLYYDYVGASPISGFSKSYSSFAQGYIGTPSFNMSYLIIYAAIATAIMWILWNKTKFGKNVFAVGGNPEAARVSGVNVAWTLVKIYALSGMYYAFGGLLEAGRIGSATNNLGNMYEMDAIAACVIGGVSFYGGVGKISGVITGVIILTVINYGLTYVGVSPYWQYIIKGMIIVAAVAFDAIKYSKKK
ncbi:galactose/methyl galactoside ABC transporter permease MglC [Fusobacterium ulcerans]|jgi:methyl-galactoside transport system permease protein|uniref:galactose/methyl galactoside ABC transporter permease MglC n=1 Tax=Fusobacterium ulcerans TaxID=861 RepID=UPI000E4E3B54|nr:galactose/methyl galactoside ABC transporter permease MglC [Fusobacterium ulcerans]MCB8563432.1 galactose/methyl galactoside ABC transporter permease MglC [Fusobacterium ulcerans]MCB8647699.1 galactose/methyl galactoside ABC transporter permease MglC [Fusobacterium ulcerans]MEE0138853.1 galactose/methyl galactoside ABC transporter permease MglC [Fusobacterium ulcerans]RGY65395.1 galactose/methyl galactoside ABC transporter permease MglC [Fusobacterium ulcerans]HJH07853.1 galactose/methyl ga